MEMRFSILLKELREASTTETFWGPFSFVTVSPSRPVDLMTATPFSEWSCPDDCTRAADPAFALLAIARKRVPA